MLSTYMWHLMIRKTGKYAFFTFIYSKRHVSAIDSLITPDSLYYIRFFSLIYTPPKFERVVSLPYPYRTSLSSGIPKKLSQPLNYANMSSHLTNLGYVNLK
jgi:hypothetical protein